MPYTLNSEHLARAFSGGQLLDRAPPVTMQVVEVGDLVVTSRFVAACDPFVDPWPEPFTQQVPNGRHPVTLAIANYGDDERVAFARVQFSPREVATWKMAVTRPTRDPSTLGPGEYFGYGVDAGVGCFMDSLAGKLLGNDYTDDMSQHMDATYQHTRSWAVIQPDPSRPETIVCFSSGVGDGSYPSFFGFSANGEVVQLVTDFCLFSEERPRSNARWWQFWK